MQIYAVTLAAGPVTLLGIGCALFLLVVGVAVILVYQNAQANGSSFYKFMQSDSNEKGKEQWIRTMTFSCVKCNATFRSRDDLLRHYDATRHDRYGSD